MRIIKQDYPWNSWCSDRLWQCVTRQRKPRLFQGRRRPFLLKSSTSIHFTTNLNYGRIYFGKDVWALYCTPQDTIAYTSFQLSSWGNQMEISNAHLETIKKVFECLCTWRNSWSLGEHLVHPEMHVLWPTFLCFAETTKGFLPGEQGHSSSGMHAHILNELVVLIHHFFIGHAFEWKLGAEKIQNKTYPKYSWLQSKVYDKWRHQEICWLEIVGTILLDVGASLLWVLRKSFGVWVPMTTKITTKIHHRPRGTHSLTQTAGEEDIAIEAGNCLNRNLTPMIRFTESEQTVCFICTDQSMVIPANDWKALMAGCILMAMVDTFESTCSSSFHDR